MTPEAAQFFLNLAFAQQDLDWMHQLAVKNQEGELTDRELQELNDYRQIGLELDLLRDKARRAIKRSSSCLVTPANADDFGFHPMPPDDYR